MTNSNLGASRFDHVHLVIASSSGPRTIETLQLFLHSLYGLSSSSPVYADIKKLGTRYGLDQLNDFYEKLIVPSFFESRLSIKTKEELEQLKKSSKTGRLDQFFQFIEGLLDRQLDYSRQRVCDGQSPNPLKRKIDDDNPSADKDPDDEDNGFNVSHLPSAPDSLPLLGGEIVLLSVNQAHVVPFPFMNGFGPFSDVCFHRRIWPI